MAGAGQMTWGVRQWGRFRRHWPWIAVAGLVAAGLAGMALDHWRKGLATIGVAAVLAALFRAVLPPRRAALFVVRSRPFDTAVLLFLGAAILVLAIVIPTIRH